MTDIDKRIDEPSGLRQPFDSYVQGKGHLVLTKEGVTIGEFFGDTADYVINLQAQVVGRGRLLTECEEVLSRFDVSVLTPISRSMYSDLMCKLINKTEAK